MVVYYTTTHYQVLCAILHKIKYEKDEKSCLVVTNARISHKNLCEKVKYAKIFDEVVYYDDKQLVAICSNEYKKIWCKWNIKGILKKIYPMIQKGLPFTINNNHKYYIMSDFKPFPLYLINHKIPYYYFEDACRSFI